MPVVGSGEGAAAPTNTGQTGSSAGRPKASSATRYASTGYAPVQTQMIPYINVPSASLPNFSTPFVPKTAADLGYAIPTVQTQQQLGMTDMTKFINALSAASKFQVPGLNLNQIARTSSKYAGQDIASAVAEYRRQQADLLKTGRLQSGLINQAGRAAANLTAPWAGQIGEFYKGLAGQAGEAAGGYSGAARDAALADASALNTTLAGIGSPQNVGPGQAVAMGSALGGYGDLARQTLAGQAGAAYTGALGIPQGMLGYAQAQAAGTLGAAMQEAAKINPQINLVEATRGQKTREYMTQLTQIAQSDRDFKLNVIQTRANILSQVGSLTQASNETKLAYADYTNKTVAAANDVASAVDTHNQNQEKINEDVRSHRMTEWQAQQANILNAQETNARIAQANQTAQAAARTLQNEIDQARGYYVDARGRKVALPGFKMNPDGTARVDVNQSPSVVSARIASKGTVSDYGKGQGWMVLPNGRVVARPGNRLVYVDKNGVKNYAGRGQWVGVERAPGQYSQGGGQTGVKAKDRAKISATINKSLGDWVHGVLPKPQKQGRGNKLGVPGYTGATATDPTLAAAAGAQEPLRFMDIVNRIVSESGGVITQKQAFQKVAAEFAKSGKNPLYYAYYNLTIDDPIVGPNVTQGVSGYGGQ